MSKEKKLVLRNPKHCQNNRVYLILYSTTLVENIYIQILESKINIFFVEFKFKVRWQFLEVDVRDHYLVALQFSFQIL